MVRTDRRPNILFIQDDQHNHRLMSCTGAPDIRTPNLDRLAASGLRFTNAFCPSAICQASRVAMLSSRNCHSTGDYENSGLIPPDLPSLVGTLRDAGYRTAALGKMHFVPQWPLHGFEKLVKGDFADCFESVEENDYYLHVKRAGMEQYFDMVGDSMRWGDLAAWPSRLPLELTQEGWLAEVACDYLEKREADRPFFCWLSYSRPHNPCSPSAPYRDMYDPAELTLPPTHPEDWAGKPFRGRDRWHDPKLIFHYPGMTEPKLRRALAYYYGLVSQVDWSIGRVLDRLDALGLAENTIVVFTSDHGDFAGEHGIVDKGVPTLDSIWKVPLLLRVPWLAPGTGAGVRHQLVNLIDLMPTLFELSGLEAPRSCEGRSLAREMSEPGWAGREAVFFEYRQVKTVRTQRYALSYYSPGEPDINTYDHSSAWAKGGELYDLEKDPEQFHNRYDDPALREVRLALTEKLLEWFCRTEPVHRAPVKTEHRPANHEISRFTSGFRFGRNPTQNREFYFRDHPPG